MENLKKLVGYAGWGVLSGYFVLYLIAFSYWEVFYFSFKDFLNPIESPLIIIPILAGITGGITGGRITKKWWGGMIGGLITSLVIWFMILNFFGVWQVSFYFMNDLIIERIERVTGFEPVEVLKHIWLVFSSENGKCQVFVQKLRF